MTKLMKETTGRETALIAAAALLIFAAPATAQESSSQADADSNPVSILALSRPGLPISVEIGGAGQSAAQPDTVLAPSSPELASSALLSALEDASVAQVGLEILAEQGLPIRN